MPRKATKNLFRRGNTQQYKKRPINKKPRKAINSIHINQTGFPSFQLIILIGISALAVFFLPIITSKIKIITRITNTNLVSLQNLLKVLTSTIYTEISKVSIPEIDLQFILVYFENIITLLNPKPLIDLVISVSNELNKLTLIYSLWSIRIISIFLIYLNPRPMILIISEFGINLAEFIFKTIHLIVSLINPFPGMKTMLELEINVINELITISGVVLFSIFKFFYFILELVFIGILNVLSFVWGILNGITTILHTTISRIAGEISYRFSIIIEFLNPYFNLVINNFSSILNGLMESAINLKKYTSAILNQYNEYRPR